MNKQPYIKAEVVGSDVNISSGGRDVDVLTLAVEIFCTTMNDKLKGNYPDDVKKELAHNMIDYMFDILKTNSQEITTIDLPPELMGGPEKCAK